MQLCRSLQTSVKFMSSSLLVNYTLLKSTWKMHWDTKACLYLGLVTSWTWCGEIKLIQSNRSFLRIFSASAMLNLIPMTNKTHKSTCLTWLTLCTRKWTSEWKSLFVRIQTPRAAIPSHSDLSAGPTSFSATGHLYFSCFMVKCAHCSNVFNVTLKAQRSNYFQTLRCLYPNRLSKPLVFCFTEYQTKLKTF